VQATPNTVHSSHSSSHCVTYTVIPISFPVIFVPFLRSTVGKIWIIFRLLVSSYTVAWIIIFWLQWTGLVLFPRCYLSPPPHSPPLQSPSTIRPMRRPLLTVIPGAWWTAVAPSRGLTTSTSKRRWKVRLDHLRGDWMQLSSVGLMAASRRTTGSATSTRLRTAI